ncbi:MAG: hypothetical protein H0V43_04710 [Gemmatimonadales bacterium]|nr:hypothetical protein [Gemmatimonadales bacterium]
MAGDLRSQAGAPSVPARHGIPPGRDGSVHPRRPRAARSLHPGRAHRAARWTPGAAHRRRRANTIRLLTLWHPDDRAPFLARAVQRIGTAETVPADHWLDGAVCAPIDSLTGELGTARLHPEIEAEATGREVCIERHPETGARITGKVLPGWDRIVSTVLRAAAALPFNRIPVGTCWWTARALP